MSSRIALAIAVLALAGIFANPARSQTTVRLSVSSAGIEADAGTWTVSLTADARLVAFSSSANDLVGGDANPGSDTFLHDRLTGATTLASIEPGSSTAGNSFASTISADGRWVAFDFVFQPVPGNNASLLYLRDIQMGVATQVSGVLGSASFQPELSADGHFMAYNRLDILGAVPTQVAVYDRVNDTHTVVSVDSSGAEGNQSSFAPSISADGRFVAFASWATNLVLGDTNGMSDIFVHDRQSGTTERVSIAFSAGEANGSSADPSFSADGRFVAFQSHASNLVAADTNLRPDIFVYDRQTGATTLVSVAAGGAQADGDSFFPDVSGDGRFVAFGSAATNLISSDTNGALDVFRRDLQVGTTTRVSVASGGVQAALLHSNAPSISDDGSRVAFWSGAANLVAGDANAANDAFLHDLAEPCPPIVDYCTAKTNSLGCTPVISTAGIPELAGADAFFVTAVHVLNQKNGMFFWGHSPASLPFGGGTLCVQPPLVRTNVQSSNGNPPPNDCSGAYSFHFGQAYMAVHGIPPGTHVFGQYWSRDSGFPPPDNIGLTDGVQFVVCP